MVWSVCNGSVNRMGKGNADTNSTSILVDSEHWVAPKKNVIKPKRDMAVNIEHSVVCGICMPFPLCRLCGLNRISIWYHASAVGSHASRSIPVHTLSCFSEYGLRRDLETNSPAAGRIWGMVQGIGDQFATSRKNTGYGLRRNLEEGRIQIGEKIAYDRE